MEQTLKEYSIDAAGKSLGRVASEAAKALMGKTSADYTPHVRSNVRVSITNAGKLHMSEKKQSAKMYIRYSGYPGGLKRESYSSLTSRRGMGEALKHAVRRMLPRNTMLVARMKNLHISE